VNSCDKELTQEYWNSSDPRSLINLVPNKFAEAFVLAYQKSPDLFGLDQKTLQKRLKEGGKAPTPTDNRIRLAFWQEYDRAQSTGRRMELTAVISGVCQPAYLYHEYFKRPEKIAWLTTPPASYEVIIKEALEYGLDQLRDILETPHEIVDEDTGKQIGINLKLAELKTKIIFNLDMRQNGAFTQKIENKNFNLSASAKELKEIHQSASMEDLQRQLEQLKKRDRLNAPVDAEFKEEE
jgi:ribosomal protein L28